MTAEVREIRREELANQGLVELLEKILAQAKCGVIQSAIIIADTRNGQYEYSRNGFPLEKAIGLHARAIHNLNREWDQL